MCAPDALATDPVSGQALIIAPGRAGLPQMIGRPDAAALCPFCPGREDQVEVVLEDVRPLAGWGWLARSLANKYPLVAPESGRHEVLLGSPRHAQRIWDLTDAEAARFLSLWHRRINACAADPRGLVPVAFMNQGALSGASQPHLHAQLVGLPAEPSSWAQRRRRAEGRCRLCAEAAGEGTHVISEGPGWVAVLPAAGRTGMVRLGPSSHEPFPAGGLGHLGRPLRLIAEALCGSIGAGGINLLLFTWPAQRHGTAHWHLELVPRMGVPSGFELATGLLTSTRSPAELAADLRRRLRDLGAWTPPGVAAATSPLLTPSR